MANEITIDGKIELYLPAYKRFIPGIGPQMTANMDGEKYYAYFWCGSPGMISQGKFITEPSLDILFIHKKQMLIETPILGRALSSIVRPPKIPHFSLCTNGNDYTVEYETGTHKRKMEGIEIKFTDEAKQSLDKFLSDWRANYI